MSGRVVVVGDLVTDVLAVLAGPPVPGTDTAARIRLAGGGQAGNTAAWLAHQQVPTTLVATVGDDAPGRARVAELTTAGVDCVVREIPGVPTGTLVVLAEPTERTMLSDRGAADHLQPADIDRALDRAAGARHLHLSGYTLLGAGSRAAGRHALAAARARGLRTSVDAASAGLLRDAGAARVLDWTRGADLLLANADEAAVLAGPRTTGDPVAQARALTAYAGAVVVKLGPAGAVWAGRRVARATAPRVPVVDPTGAGDAFAAGLLAAWLAGAGPATALRAGIRLGARAVSVPGARPASAPRAGRP